MSKQGFRREIRLGNLPLKKGGVLQDAVLTAWQVGELNARRDNLVVVPCYYGGTYKGSLPLVGADGPLGGGGYCVVLFDMFGNGEASSPSRCHPSQAGHRFPAVTLDDNVEAQRRALDTWFGSVDIALITGWSMGGMQGFLWAALHPRRVQRLLPVCATACCWPHNRVFLDGVRSALMADPVFAGGRYRRVPEAGLKAFARVYAGWAYSQAFFRRGLYRELGFDDVATLLEFWEQDHLAQDANDLLAVMHAWEQADPGDNALYGGDYRAALAAITARTRVMPCRTDLYFTVEDARHEMAWIPGARLQVLDSDYGHAAGAPGRESAAMEQWGRAMADLLSES